MSRTIEVPQTQSPVKAHIFFNGDLGKFSMLTGDGQELQELPMPFSFVCLDVDTSKVGGKLGLDRNAPKFKSTLSHPKYGRRMKVWLDNDPGNIIATGTWGEMKDKPALSSAKFVSMLFVLTSVGDGKEIACIQLSGRAYAAWLNATQKQKINPCGNLSFRVAKTETMAGDKGKPSLVPVFETGQLSDEMKALAEQADFDLQSWLCEQFSNESNEYVNSAQGAGASRANYAAKSDESAFPTHETGNAKQIPVPSDIEDLPF